jgi:inner membrane protein
MPTIFTHAAAGAALGQWQRARPAGFWFWTLCCAILPDADVVAFAFGIPYGAMLGHRGLTHSLTFAAALGAVVAAALGRGVHRPARMSLFFHFSLVTASHGLLDALTDGGLGAALLAPFSGARYFFPWRPIAVSPIGGGFFTARNLDGVPRWLTVVASELLWVGFPAAIVAFAARVRRRAQ